MELKLTLKSQRLSLNAVILKVKSVECPHSFSSDSAGVISSALDALLHGHGVWGTLSMSVLTVKLDFISFTVPFCNNQWQRHRHSLNNRMAMIIICTF